jgi:hypothetical protein
MNLTIGEKLGIKAKKTLSLLVVSQSIILKIRDIPNLPKFRFGELPALLISKRQ